MAIIINEEKFINDNIFEFEKRLSSSLSRFLDRAPSFVTYFSINTMESTANEGFMDVESVIGGKSPLRFNKIDNLPVHGLEQVVLSLNDDDQGIDSSYEGELVLLPNTVIPNPNDFFIINHVQDRSIIFRVTQISYDTLRADGYYKVSFKLEYIDAEKGTQLEEQVIENYKCILENIGTNSNCIIQKDVIEKMVSVSRTYDDIALLYKKIYYSEKYNCLLGYNGNVRVYDSHMTTFVNTHSLFNNPNDISTMMLTQHNTDRLLPVYYENSIWRSIEKNHVANIPSTKYMYKLGCNYAGSGFNLWYDKSIVGVELFNSLQFGVASSEMYPYEILSFEDVDKIRSEEVSDDVFIETLRLYYNNKLTIDNIPKGIYDSIIRYNTDLKVFFYVPMILYIIKKIVENILKKE